MIIILEGPDGSGKTTLAKRIAKRFNGNRIHSGGKIYTEKEYDRRMEYLKKLARGNTVNVIDRVTWISERIYSDALGRKKIVSEEKMNKDMKSLNCKVIYCRPTSLTIDRMVVDNSKEHKSPELYEQIKDNYGKILEGYDTFFAGKKPFVNIKYDYDKDDIKKVYNFIKP